MQVAFLLTCQYNCNMLHRVTETIEKNSLIKRGDRVLCAVSGGADSVVLLHVLCSLAKDMGFTLFAAHFNHCIRGSAADRDELFVKELCKKMNVDCVVKKADVPQYARENGYTLEQAGRLLRYEFFNELKADKVAVAHHMDDQAESIMMHIIRGSGTLGLCGMRYRRGNIIRPLLSVRRADIEKYADENKLSFCTDDTNFIADGTRNKLRLEIIPSISNNINGGFTEALCAMADIVRKDDDYLCDIAERELALCAVGDGYNRHRLAGLDEPIRRRAIRIAAVRAGAYADIEQRHVELIEKLLCARTGACLHLPHIIAWTAYEKIYFSTREKYVTMSNVNDFCIKFCAGEAIDIPLGRITSVVVEGNGFVREKNTAYIDLDDLPQDAVVRSRRPGDRISPIGISGSKKLKDFFIDRKIERQERNMPLICSGKEVLCIIGMTVSRSVMVTDDTKRMLKITFDSEARDETI